LPELFCLFTAQVNCHLHEFVPPKPGDKRVPVGSASSISRPAAVASHSSSTDEFWSTITFFGRLGAQPLFSL
jgi:hypothetical protein